MQHQPIIIDYFKIIINICFPLTYMYLHFICTFIVLANTDLQYWSTTKLFEDRAHTWHRIYMLYLNLYDLKDAFCPNPISLL